MRLKKLELFGFKSFADRTEVLFDEGVTCIVGPNGCGKSNISDAIRWVLGERSAKLLRGSKMEDVIFNGTDFRKPLAIAEVSLTIDNSDRGLPIDYQEVTITRRLYRSGESEYLVNKTACRLKDIQDLILDTGIGSSSYSMIEQGRIDYILNADADERRFLIEEAAGISKYKVKKEEAVRKLEKTEENRLRLNDIVTEVHRNIQYAERQAKRAERYRDFFEKLKNLEIKKAFHDQTMIQDETRSVEVLRDVKKEELSAREAEMAGFRVKQDELSQAVRDISGQYAAEEAKRQALQSRMDQINQLLQFHQEKRMEMATRRGQIEQEANQLAVRIEKNGREIEAKQCEFDGLTGEREQTYQLYRQSEDALGGIEGELVSAKESLEAIKMESLEAAADLVQLRNEYHRLSAFVETRHEQKRHREANVVRLQQEAGQWKSKETSCLEELRLLEGRLGELRQRRDSLTDRLRQLREGWEFEQRELVRLERLTHEHETELKWLEELEAASTQQEASLLEAEEGFRRECVKTLREVVQVKPGYEWALETALDSFANLLIADNRETAEQLVKRLQDQRFPTVGVLIRPELSADAVQPALNEAIPSVVCSLAQVVEVQAGYEGLLSSFLSRTFIVETSEHSRMIRELWDFAAEYRFVAPNGMLFGPERKILAKSRIGVQEGMSLERSARIESLRRETESGRSRIAELQSSLQTGRMETDRLIREEEAVSSELLEATIQKESSDSLRQGMEERLGAYQRELDLLFMETKEMQIQQEEAMQKRSSLEASLHQAEIRERRIAQTQNDLIVRIETLDQRKTEALKRFAETKVRWEKFEEKLQLLEGALSVLKESDTRDRSRTEQLAFERADLEQREARLLGDDEILRGECAVQEQARRDSEVALELIRLRREEAEKALSEFQRGMDEIHRGHQKIQEELHEHEMKLMDLSFQVRAIGERLSQAYRLRLADFNPADYAVGAEESVEEMNAEIEMLRDKVEKLGTVNLLAIEEYEELKQRYEFLMTQQKDLEEAKNALLETIRKINRTTKGLFEETFKNVQIAFQHYYETLFQGGYAKLVLIDEENPIESGIDIVVRPPAKKPTHISLLSGGEKALTAIALLFALFKIKPSPFCVMDEVDAPLDEANVDRFVTALREFLTVSQFIIVTHNRKTIAMGDALFGVTMQEPGISKIVSVKVSHDETEAVPAEGEMSLDELIDDGQAAEAVAEEERVET